LRELPREAGYQSTRPLDHYLLPNQHLPTLDTALASVLSLLEALKLLPLADAPLGAALLEGERRYSVQLVGRVCAFGMGAIWRTHQVTKTASWVRESTERLEGHAHTHRQARTHAHAHVTTACVRWCAPAW
jgi:hypothetical protein